MDIAFRADLIDGKSFAARLVDDLAVQVRSIMTETGKVPGLAVVLIGEDPASAVYVNSKHRQTVQIGMRFQTCRHRDTAEFRHQIRANASLRNYRPRSGRGGRSPLYGSVLRMSPLPMLPARRVT
ncbi:methylenetetrahydrofolate dehydrogenase (NADP+) / methenyltetrahydrofolate cyclohydrolase [Rhodobacter sp. 24-YEA-8]|nr:methylenetetrahydrofolate dehydrogenase (NADP+) / methenyltetrahydrofolate cyclohydrolase [Rhodobacter sp. 24-YEA-8]